MTEGGQVLLADSNETGFTGIYQLKRIWSKAILGLNGYDDEWPLDNAVFSLLGIGLLPAYGFLHEKQPGFSDFEKWVVAHHGGEVPGALKDQCNALVTKQAVEVAANIHEDVLLPDDLVFWEEHGYVIVRNAIPQEDCAASKKAVWDFLGMDENKPESWYRTTEALQGIMVQLYRHPVLDKNRASLKIRKAFEQIWGHGNLVVTADKTGFNPPETDTCKFKGSGLHWDVSLAQPIPFGVQGILYLTDTAADQGALTVVPGFHRTINDWLLQLPAGTNPRNEDFSKFNPLAIAANAGDFIIWHHALPHGSSPNRAGTPRIVQYLYWQPLHYEVQEEWV
jgi:diadenosine tetraphosphatase ApaH/serine/threonine PP2A family protein phosphatase